MHHTIVALLLLFCFGAAACDRADQIIDAVDTAKTMKGDLEKKANEVKKDIMSRAGEIPEGVRKDIEGLPDGEKGRESSGEREDKKEAHGERRGKDD